MNANGFPAYLSLYKSGELRERMFRAQKILLSCSLCPRNCRARRLDGERGECGGGVWAEVASYAPHFGEESPLVGFKGSGTIFFSHCPLHCVFCQNWDISQAGAGTEVRSDELADMMMALQRFGCHNINVVTPTHYVPHILEALLLACETGLAIPIVYNSGGYESLETLALLDGVVDIYMPDFKYGDAADAKRYSDVDDYPRTARAALKEMHRQVGDLVLDGRGIAVKGLLVRHLVLPNNLAGTREALRFIAEEVSKETYVNIMDQYRPSFNAAQHADLARRITPEEFRRAVAMAGEFGLLRLDGS
ncbi:MAG: radical SAM protein [Chitinivibrionia bacterium]|nr:radical SAM protein [Chitinivibrionia bacterium]